MNDLGPRIRRLIDTAPPILLEEVIQPTPQDATPPKRPGRKKTAAVGVAILAIGAAGVITLTQIGGTSTGRQTVSVGTSSTTTLKDSVTAPDSPTTTLPTKSTSSAPTTPTGITNSTLPGGVVVPLVVGETGAAAAAKLSDAGLAFALSEVESPQVPAGEVASTSPAAGTVVASGTTIVIDVSAGSRGSTTTATPTSVTGPTTPPPSKSVRVPLVVGETGAAAATKLSDAGLAFALSVVESPQVPAGEVASTSPVAGTIVASGTTVTIDVSAG